MVRRIEAGPIAVVVGAVVLLVALFLEWFEPGADAWTVFEVWDLVLAMLAVGAAVAAIGLLLPEIAVLDRRWLAPLSVAALVIVASQIIDPPPAVAEGERGPGSWLALVGALVMVAGALLSLSRVRLALTVEGRDPRRRQAAVVREPGARAAPAPAVGVEPEAAAAAEGAVPPAGAEAPGARPPRGG